MPPMNWSAFWRIQSYADFLPRDCLHCKRLSHQPLCSDCAALLRPYPRHCRHCSRLLAHGEICGNCLQQTPPLAGLSIAFCFEDLAHDMVLAAKYGASRPALAVMAQHMAALALPAVECVLPIPIASARLWQRGFNQSHYLAAAVAKQHGLRLDKTLLHKAARPPQSTLAAKQRQKNMAGAFSVQGECPKTLLLVDDVYTTGATLREAAKTLKAAGAEHIFAAVFAAVILH